jgi:hypothetical protein
VPYQRERINARFRSKIVKIVDKEVRRRAANVLIFGDIKFGLA